MGRPLEIYLDIETDWDRNITVLGFYSSQSGLVQLVGSDITRQRLLQELPQKGALFTFNGHSFDLPVIKAELDVCLRSRYSSRDLRHVCRGHGLIGGQKAIERTLRIERTLPEMDGRDAIRLWKSYQRGNATALETLLSYNKEDISGMQQINRKLSRGDF